MGTKVVRVDPGILVEMFTTGWTPVDENSVVRCCDGLPPGSRIIGVDFDVMKFEILLLVEHESFKDSPSGHHRLYHEVIYERVPLICSVAEMSHN